MTSQQPDWVPFSTAVFAVAAAHYPDLGPNGYDAAVCNITRRLETMDMRAKCRSFKRSFQSGLWDDHPLNEDGTVPAKFWSDLRFSHKGPTDWRLGDFIASFIDVSYSVTGAEIWRGDLPQSPEMQNFPEVRLSNKAGRGRKPANWWPDFAEELVHHFFAHGLPGGEAGQGQTEVFERVCRAMQARGIEEPTRSTALEVIGKILKRLRSEN